MISSQIEMDVPRTNTRKRQPFTQRYAAVIFHSSASTAATFDRGLLASQSRLLTFFPSLLLPVFSSAALCVQIVCVGYPFSYSFACVSYPAISTTHSHTYIQTLYICTVTHKHNHRQRCNLLCNFFSSSHSVLCCLAKLIFLNRAIIKTNYFTFSRNSSPAFQRGPPNLVHCVDSA